MAELERKHNAYYKLEKKFKKDGEKPPKRETLLKYWREFYPNR